MTGVDQVVMGSNPVRDIHGERRERLRVGGCSGQGVVLDEMLCW